MTNETVLYIETCNSLRHYSNSILEIRKLLIVQGLVILASSGLAYVNDKIEIVPLIYILGLAFTFTLLKQQDNYRKDFEIHLEYIQQYERCLEDNTSGAAWTNYKKNRHVPSSENLSGFYKSVVIGPYNFFFLVYGTLLLISVFMILNDKLVPLKECLSKII